MKLSIITINYNNAEGLQRTLDSVAGQTCPDIEHIIVDGNSTDNSLALIQDYYRRFLDGQLHLQNVLWLSEPDSGIYNAMNKGIEIALGRRIVNSFNRSELVEDRDKGIRRSTGDYIQILNSGDVLASPDVTARMLTSLDHLNQNADVELLYGNMIKKDFSSGKIIGKSGEVEYSLRQYYSATLNHDCCYIRQDLFCTYGLYDESLSIVSDWKWFLQAIGLGHVKPVYVDVDVTVFDANGVSETNLSLRNQERRIVLESLLPPAILRDYDLHAFDAVQMNRLRRHRLYGLVYLLERVLFKMEKAHLLKP
ncbi:MAG: glycosyltransferase [Paludibacteraceae bacterium]|nr:glycosyltransferase [Paludibacteraceae bacterium]